MIFRYFGTSVLALLTFLLVFVSCSDEWDKHYNDVSIDSKSDLNLYDYIKSKDNLTRFTSMLETTGYDSILSEPLSFTVWAPNDDALSGVSTDDEDLALKIVENSIARYSYTTSGISEENVRMLNSKLLLLESSGSGYLFDSASIAESDLATANGILHVTSEYVPYRMNLWEFINNTSGLDSLRDYANALSIVELDSASSYENGIFVDSVYKTTNKLLDNLADLNVEDSIYTALLLDNTAWTAAYDSIAPFYKMTTADGGEAQQRASSLWALASNLFYRGKIADPASKSVLISTGKCTTYEPDVVFQNSQKNVLSNGLGFVTSEFNVKDTASWNKTIKMEAETSTYGRTLLNYTPVVQSGVGIGYDISGKKYLALTDAALGSASKLSVTFPIPYTLSTKYNIYCVFVPRMVLDSTSLLPYQVKFYLTYLNSSGTSTTMYVNSSHNVKTSASSLASFVTNPLAVDTMLVAKDVELPFSNVIFNTDTSDDFNNNINFSLKVENAASKTSKVYNRNIMIDCIILEPVKE